MSANLTVIADISSVVVPQGAIFTASASNPGVSVWSNVPLSCKCLEAPKFLNAIIYTPHN